MRVLFAPLLLIGLASSGATRSPLAHPSPCGPGADDLLTPTGVVAFRTRLTTPVQREWTIAPLRPPASIHLSLEGARLDCRLTSGSSTSAGGCTLVVYAGDPRLGAAELFRLPRSGASPPAKVPLTAESSSVVLVLLIDEGLGSVDVSFKVTYTADGIAPAAMPASGAQPAPSGVDGGAPSLWHDGFGTKDLDIPEKWAEASPAAVVGGQCGASGESGRALVFGGPHAQPAVATSALLQVPPTSLLHFSLRIGAGADAGGDPSGQCGPGSGGAVVSWAPSGRGPAGPFDTLVELGVLHPAARDGACFTAWSDVTLELPSRVTDLVSLRWAARRPPGSGTAPASALWAIDEVRVRAYGTPDTTGAGGIVPSLGWVSPRHSAVVAAGSGCLAEAVPDGSRCDLRVVLSDARGEPRGPLPAETADRAVQAWVGLAAGWRAWPHAPAAGGGAGAPPAGLRRLHVVAVGDGSYGIELGELTAAAQPGLVPARGSAEAAANAAADRDGAVARLAVAVLVAGQHAHGSPFQVVVLPAPDSPDGPPGFDPDSGNGTCACECSGAASAAARARRGPAYYVGLLTGGLFLVSLLAAILGAYVLLQRTRRQEAAAARAGGYASFESRALPASLGGGGAPGAGPRRVGGGDLRPARSGGLGADGGLGAAGTVLAGAAAAAEATGELLGAAARGAAGALAKLRGGRGAAGARDGGWGAALRARQPQQGQGQAGAGGRAAVGSLDDQRSAMAFFASTAAADALRPAAADSAGWGPPQPSPAVPPDPFGAPAPSGDALGLMQPVQPGFVASPLGALPMQPPSRPPPPPPTAVAPGGSGPAGTAGGGLEGVAVMESDSEEGSSEPEAE